jgi:hypothetical protein
MEAKLKGTGRLEGEEGNGGVLLTSQGKKDRALNLNRNSSTGLPSKEEQKALKKSGPVTYRCYFDKGVEDLCTTCI